MIRRSIPIILVLVMVAGLAMADPWRVRITDMDTAGPLGGGVGPWPIDLPWMFPNEMQSNSQTGSWSSAGGTFRYYRMWSQVHNASYTASTGALTLEYLTYVSLTGVGMPRLNGWVDNTYKYTGSVWESWWRNIWAAPNEVDYAASTDGLNYLTMPVACTLTGASNQTYGPEDVHITTDGARIMVHSDAYVHGRGMSTATNGTTLWQDIDGHDHGDAHMEWIHDPDSGPGISQYAKFNLACDGNLFMTQESYISGNGLGLVIGTNGAIGSGGPDYVWVSDPNGTDPTLLPSLMSGLGLVGLSAPNIIDGIAGFGLKTTGIGLVNGDEATTPATKFLIIYGATYDTTGVPGGAYTRAGIGRATLELTKNNADVNFDGTVNFSDLSGFSASWGKSTGDPQFIPSLDSNGDGTISFPDLSAFSVRWGKDCTY